MGAQGKSPRPRRGLALGRTLGLSEDSDTSPDQTGRKKHDQQRVGNHQVKDAANQGGESGNRSRNGANPSRNCLLRSFLLSHKMIMTQYSHPKSRHKARWVWLRGLDSNQQHQVQSLASYHYYTPRYKTPRTPTDNRGAIRGVLILPSRSTPQKRRRQNGRKSGT